MASAPERADRRPVWTAYGLAMAAALALGHFLLGLPIQVSDSLVPMLDLSTSWSDLLDDKFSQRSFMRPFMWAELKVVYDLSGGNYTPWFRWTHVVQGFTLTTLFVALARPRSWRDVACVPFGLAVLFGMHTFTGTVHEAYPVNTFMTLLVLTFAATLVALRRYHPVNDLIAVVLFVVAALTVETGLLLWVIFIAAALIGARGVSRPGLAVLTLLLGAYFYIRFVVLQIGSPGLLERSSGFGFAILDPPELIEEFGANPVPFYIYNTVSAILSILFSEPIAGVFRAAHAVTTGAVRPWIVVNLVASAGVFALMLWFAWVRRRVWLSWRFEHHDRLVLLFGVVLIANAVISYPYSKETNMTTAGAFLALAAFAAARHLLATVGTDVPGAAAVALAGAALVVSSAWAVRTAAMFDAVRDSAVRQRLDWAYIESRIAHGRVEVEGDEARALVEKLKEDALIARPAPPSLALPFAGLYEE
jgi:hypothetical protein